MAKAEAFDAYALEEHGSVKVVGQQLDKDPLFGAVRTRRKEANEYELQCSEPVMLFRPPRNTLRISLYDAR